jgi:hypothetical protein
MPNRVVRAMLLLAVGLALTVAPALPASAEEPASSAEFGAAATLVAKGAAVTVPVNYTCSDAAFADMYLRLTQRVGNSVAWGEQWANNLTCDGIQHPIEVTFRPSGTVPFKRGVAYAEAAFTVCGQFSCAPTVRISKEIWVR